MPLYRQSSGSGIVQEDFFFMWELTMHISVRINSALALNKRDFKAPKCKGPLLNGPCRNGGAGGSNFPDALREINVPHKCCTTKGNGDASN